ncbi:MAG: cupin domain-containing protein [Candidatus Baltobacteraceae bacterium]
MKPRFYLALFLAIGMPLAVSAAAAGPTIIQPDATKWTVMTSGPMAGASMAVLMGNPAKRGPYIIRVKVKDGTRFNTHFHTEVENVTVISGTLLVGLGDTMAGPDKMTALGPGAFASVPPNLHHYAIAKGETVIQIDALGPRTSW